MNREERLKLHIQNLESKRAFHKFEHQKINNNRVGLLTILVSIFIPIIIVLQSIFWMILLYVAFQIMLIISFNKMNPLLEKHGKMVKKLSEEIDYLYAELLNGSPIAKRKV